MSCAAFGLLMGYVLVFGTTAETPDGDEGTAARIFQILMLGQLPVMLYFLYRELPNETKNALMVLLLQILVSTLPFTALYYFEHL